jgi:hypothetical protein
MYYIYIFYYVFHSDVVCHYYGLYLGTREIV